MDLCNLPNDILGSIISRETILFEKHILRFVCKKIHDITHRICRFLSIKFLCFEKFDELAAMYGNIDLLKWTISTLCKEKSPMVFYSAARCGGSVELMKYIRSIHYSKNKSICDGAIKGGNLEVLKWAIEIGYPLDKDTCANAALAGQFEALRAALARNTKMGQRK
jgi:hypothetical protein